MGVGVRGVRKRNRIKWKIKSLNGQQEYIIWRTERCRLSREYITEVVGLDVGKYGSAISQLTFRIRKHKT